MPSVTFGSLKRDLLAALGVLERAGTASGGTAATLVDAGVLSDEDNFFRGYRTYIHNGPAQGDERKITASSQSSENVTVSPNFSAPPTTASEYLIYDTYRMVTIERALINAMHLLRPSLLVPLEDKSIDFGDPETAASYSVTAPTYMASVYRIIREDIAKDDVHSLVLPGPADSKAPWWNVSRSGVTNNIIFDREAHLRSGFMVEGRNLKIIGQQYQQDPTDDDSTITVNPAPIIWVASHLVDRPDVDQRAARANARALADYLNAQQSRMWPGSVILGDW